MKLKEDFKNVMDYITAVGMLAKTDIHLRMEFDAFMLFFEVYRKLVIRHEKLDNEADVFETGIQQIEGMLRGRAEYDNNIKLAQLAKSGTPLPQRITLREVTAMKNYCSIYLLTAAVRSINNSPGIRLAPDNTEDKKEI